MKRYILFFMLIVSVCTFLFADNHDKAVELYNEGVDFHDGNKPDKALEKYLEALGYDTSIGEVYLNIGLIYIEKNDLDKGEEYTLKALDTFIETDKKISAEQSFERLLAITANNLGVVYLRKMDLASNNSKKQKHLEDALKSFCYALEFDPDYNIPGDNYEAYLPDIEKSALDFYDDGVDYQDEEKNVEAIACFRIAKDLDPSIGEAYLNIGLGYLRGGLYDECIYWSKNGINILREHKKVIAAGQTLEELVAICYLNMGLAYIGKAREADANGNYDDADIYHQSAIGCWDKGIKEDPSCAHIKKIYNTYKDSYK